MSVRRAGSMLDPPKDQIEVGERILACESRFHAPVLFSPIRAFIFLFRLASAYFSISGEYVHAHLPEALG